MSRNKQKQSKIKFDHNWHCCCSTDDVDISIISNTNGNDDDRNWISIQLPHITDKKEQETDHTSLNNKQIWWYRKQVQWKTHFQNNDQRISLLFESLKDYNTDESNNDYSSIDTLTVWLNDIQIFSDSFQSPKLSIDLTDQLICKENPDENNRKNTLVVCCKNASLSLHTYLLLPRDLIHTIEQEDINTHTGKTSDKLPLRKNRVLDYLVGFNDDDGRFDIGFNSRLKSPITPKLPNPPQTTEQRNIDGTIDGNYGTLPVINNHIFDYLVNLNDSNIDCDQKSRSPTPSKHLNPPDITVSEDHAQEDEEIVDNRENTEEFYVPRLTILILIVGTRGDVQPFIAFGQTLRAVGHRVRLATHEKFRKYVREHGLEFYPLASNPEDLMSFVVKNGGVFPSMSSIFEGELKKKRRDISDILQSTWLACTQNDDETSIPFTAEVIIANPPSFGHVHCAQKLQIPLYIIFTMPWSPTTVFPHPFCKVDHSKIPKEKLNLLSYSVMETLTWSGINDLVNNFRRETLDLPPLYTRQAVQMLIDEQVPHIYCWSPSLVPKPFDWPPHINISGYFFLKSNDKQFKPPDDLIAFLGLNNDKKNEEKLSPPIYVGFGSITGNDSHHLLQVVLSALERTGYRALLSGFDKENDKLPDTVLRIGDIPHEWLFQHVSAVCHHGGAGTVAAGLRAGKPSIIVPFFGDQFFWGNVVAKNGAGTTALPGKHVTVDQLVEAFKEVHQSEMRMAAEHIRNILTEEDGCANALRLFHAHLPLSRMCSDLESTFPACYRVNEFDLQVSRPVAQVLVALGVLDESQFRPHATRDWASIYDYHVHVPTSGVLRHTHKAFSHIFIQTASGMRRAVSSTNLLTGVASGVGGAVKDIGKGIGHLSVGILSLYGELTDVLDRVPSVYDPYRESDAHERPRVVDFKSGVKAAGLSIGYGWRDGITGFAQKPRIGYRRYGLLGGATGALVATANGLVKPAVGSLASITWLGRGMYATVTKKKKTKEDHILINRSPGQPSSALSSSPDTDDDEADIPANIKFAAIVSGYPAVVCQQILDEFEKVKKHQEEIASISSNENHKHQHRFLQHRRHSDSAL